MTKIRVLRRSSVVVFNGSGLVHDLVTVADNLAGIFYGDELSGAIGVSYEDMDRLTKKFRSLLGEVRDDKEKELHRHIVFMPR